MTPEEKAEVQEYISQSMKEGLKSAFGEFQGYFKDQLKENLSPIQSKLAEFDVALPPNDPEPDRTNVPSGNPETDALMQRLAKMEKAEQERLQELRQYKFTNELASTVSKYDPLHQDIAKELLMARYAGKAIEKDGSWYLPSGNKLTEEIDGFFKSDAGQHFIKNPAGKSSGQQGSSKLPVAQGNPNPSSDDMLTDWQL